MPNYKLNLSAINEMKKIYSEFFRLLEENKYREAERLFVWGLKKRPADKSLSLGLARCYCALKKNEDAERVFEWLIAERFESAYKYYGFYLDKEGQTDKAIIVLKEFARYYPHNTEAYKMLCHSYEKKGEHQKAIDMINEGILVNPNKDSLIVKKAQVLENMNEYDCAIRLLEWATSSKFRENLKLQLSLGHCYEKNLQQDRAIEHFKNVISKFPQEDSPKRALINIYIKLQMTDLAGAIFSTLNDSYLNKLSYGSFIARNGQWNEAIRIINVLINQEPTRIDAYLAKSKILEDSHIYGDAIEFYNYTKSKFPQNSSEIDLRLGYCELSRGNLGEAEKCFERLESFPELKLDMLEAKAYLLHDKEAYAAALDIVHYLKQIYFNSNNEYRLRLTNRLGAKIYRKLKYYDEALKEHNYNLSYLKGDISDQYWLAMIYQEKGDLDNSISIARNIIEKYPHYKEARLLFAILLESKRDDTAAEKAFFEIFEDFPNYKEARLSYTVFLKKASRYQDEINEFLNIKALFPHYKEAGLAYVKRLRQIGNINDAFNEVNQLCDEFPNWQHSMLMKAEILSDMGQLDDAFRMLDDIIEKYPDFESARIKRAMTLEDMGKLDDAKMAFWDAYTLHPNSQIAVLGYIRVLMSIRDYGRVEQCYAYLTSNNLMTKEIKLAYASFYGLTKRFDKADDLFKSLLSENPDYQNAFLKYAQYLEKAKRHEGAISEFENICERFPDNPRMFLAHAQFWESMEDRAQTIKAYKELKNRFPQYQKGLLHFAIYLSTQSGKRKEADSLFNEIIENFPLYLEAKVKYLQFCSWHQTWAETETQYNKLLAKHAYSQSLHAQYIDFIWFQRDYKNTLRQIESFKRKFKYNQYLYRKHILILIDDGKRAAIKQFKYASKKFPHNLRIAKLKHKIDLLQSNLDSASDKGNRGLYNNNNVVLYLYTEQSNDRKRKPKNKSLTAAKKFQM
jgi:tetratricopeptide (TPR) repeat protein